MFSRFGGHIDMVTSFSNHKVGSPNAFLRKAKRSGKRRLIAGATRATRKWLVRILD